MLEGSNKLEKTLYVGFLTLTFGVFIAVWVEPMSKVISGAQFNGWEVLRGIFVFTTLICLWWWYTHIVGEISPAQTFGLYAFDFVTLGVFAMGFSSWTNPAIFNWVIIIGSALAMIRLVYIWKKARDSERMRKVFWFAFVPITLFATHQLIVAIGLLTGSLVIANPDSYIDGAATVYLAAVLIATILASRIHQSPLTTRE